jgi:hypothetical protein
MLLSNLEVAMYAKMRKCRAIERLESGTLLCISEHLLKSVQLCYDIERGSYVNYRTPLLNAQRLNIFKKIKIPSELGSQRTLGSVGCNYPN